LLGATAVEDRLQEEVMETILDMQRADIKVWMLTGDKFETAENIGISCGLLKPQVHTYRLNWSEGHQWQRDLANFCSEDMAREHKERVKVGKKTAVIVEGRMLTKIISDLGMKNSFLQIAKTCETVVCCRVSPSQKAEVVRLIKNDDPSLVTMAIGDGANDVSMIREANVGIGLYGNEGIRAA